MVIHNTLFRYVHRRPWVTCLLAVLIAANYALSVRLDGSVTPRLETLVRLGALTGSTIAEGAYWRLLAAGFLHATPIHLVGNLLCLGVWGTILENRVGALYFVVIFAISLVAGGYVSIATHSQALVGVGASGAIAGIFGAMMGLAILGKLNLSPGFIVANLLINVALALTMPNLDWQAHLGGLTAGLATCACLDLLLKASHPLIRCKFPEFVKLNATILIAIACFLAAFHRPPIPQGLPIPMAAAIVGAAALIGVKLLDILLAVTKGLLLVTALFAILNAVAVWCLAPWLERLWAAECGVRTGFLGFLPGTDAAYAHICPMPSLAVPLVCGAAFVVTGLVYVRAIIRGWRDVGFVAAGLIAEGRRSNGL